MSLTGPAGGTGTIRCTGLTATRYRIVDADTGSSVVVGPVTTGITQTGTLRYKATATWPAAAGDYEVQWDDGSGAWTAIEDVTVTGSSGGSGGSLSAGPWPVGTTVGAYTTRGDQTLGPPIGSALATAQVASDGTLTFTGLAPGPYVAAAFVSGTWVKVRFYV